MAILTYKLLNVHVRHHNGCLLFLHIDPAADIQEPPAAQKAILIDVNRLVGAYERKGSCDVPDQEVSLCDFLAASHSINGVAAVIGDVRVYRISVLLLHYTLLFCAFAISLIVRFIRSRICLCIRTVQSPQILVGITRIFSRTSSRIE